MIKIYGKIESLKKIRVTLMERGLNEFNSIGEINRFLQNYDSEVRKIRKEAELQITREQEHLNAEKAKLAQQQDHLKDQAIVDTKNEITKLRQRIANRELKESKNIFYNIINKLILSVLRSRQQRIEVSRQKRIKKETAHLYLKSNNIIDRLHNITVNKLGMVEERIAPKLEKLHYTKGVIEEINPLIAGAIGESKVEKELKTLSVHGVLLNDFSLKFKPPIYNRKEKDRIYSIQIDHLLITGAGLFALESKNWSKKSIERLDLRSPVAQIKRSSYAMFVLVNSTDDKSLGMKLHHWGKKQIPIRNIIVMIGQKPKESFKYVKVKTLHELNGYVEHFESIFNDDEVSRIAQYLQGQQHDVTSERMKKGKPLLNDISWFRKDGNKTINDRYQDRWS